jgi:2'-5' RNA ligase
MTGFFAILVESAIAATLGRRAASWRRALGCEEDCFKQNAWICVGLRDHGLPGCLVEIACRIGSRITAKPFNASFDRLSAFGGGALVLRCSMARRRCRHSDATSPPSLPTAR